MQERLNVFLNNRFVLLAEHRFMHAAKLRSQAYQHLSGASANVAYVVL
jgi:hypothetical protein